MVLRGGNYVVICTNHSIFLRNLSYTPVNKTLGDPGFGTKSYRSSLKKGEDIYILTSCHSTLQALERQEAKMLTVQECTLECLAISNKVTIVLDTSHEGHSLGTIAGDQAKLATVKDSHMPPPPFQK